MIYYICKSYILWWIYIFSSNMLYYVQFHILWDTSIYYEMQSIFAKKNRRHSTEKEIRQSNTRQAIYSRNIIRLDLFQRTWEIKKMFVHPYWIQFEPVSIYWHYLLAFIYSFVTIFSIIFNIMVIYYLLVLVSLHFVLFLFRYNFNKLVKILIE